VGGVGTGSCGMKRSGMREEWGEVELGVWEEYDVKRVGNERRVVRKEWLKNCDYAKL
jgi:hypothetical protein